MHVVHREEKEARIKDFILTDIAARKATGASLFGCTYCLVARSWESPASRALLAVVDEAVAIGIGIRAVLVQHVGAVKSDAAARLPSGGCRTVSDPRLLEAHEQLVLGDCASWIGDCMRRDPARRDTYETFCDGTSRSTLWAARSFEHLWTAADPANLDSNFKSAPADAFIGASLIAVSDPELSAVALRH
jgi:hypothetical protein